MNDAKLCPTGRKEIPGLARAVEEADAFLRTLPPTGPATLEVVRLVARLRRLLHVAENSER